ncbi:MAG: ribonuclease P protein component [Jiangellaceae bacterium]|nr:ribonuclease P protein component [Jiangellaceae bacterium]
MLPPQNRLRRSLDHRSTVRRGIRVSRGLLVIHFLAPHTAAANEPVRAGFVVGRAVGTAVVRNAVRRRLRHLLRDRLNRLPGGSRVVVRAGPAAATATSTALARELDDALDAAVAAWRRTRQPGSRPTVGAVP